MRTLISARTSIDALTFLDKNKKIDFSDDGLLISIGRKFNDVAEKLLSEPSFSKEISIGTLADGLEAAGAVGNLEAFTRIRGEIKKRIQDAGDDSALKEVLHRALQDGIQHFIYWSLINGHVSVIESFLSDVAFNQRNMTAGHLFSITLEPIVDRLTSLARSQRLTQTQRKNIKRALIVLDPYVRMQLAARSIPRSESESICDKALQDFHAIINAAPPEIVALIYYWVICNGQLKHQYY